MHVTVAARYARAPATQLAHAHHILDMNDAEALAALIDELQPDLIMPEIEAIDVDVLCDAERDGIRVIPSARTVATCMNRRTLRTLAAERLGFRTSRHGFAYSTDELHWLLERFGTTCHVKPLQSSSGKGQSRLERHATKLEVALAWQSAMAHSYHDHDHVIIEAHVPFEQEITLLTIACTQGVFFCAPIGHEQRSGDYIRSWQPADITNEQLEAMQQMARELVTELGGYGLFGVEFFISADGIYFSEVSPRPHDTGLVTLVTQPLNEFDLHIKAATTGLVQAPICDGPGASGAIIAQVDASDPVYTLDPHASLSEVDVHMFDKPEAYPGRRMGVVLTRGTSITDASNRITTAQQAIDIKNKKT